MKNLLTKFQNRRRLEDALYFWVTALRSNFKSMTVEQCVLNFFKYMEISEEDWNLKTALTTYNRMQLEAIEDKKSVKDS
jgi:hypothetical protein